MILKARKLTYLILLTICVYGAQAQPITLPQLVTESLLYKNQYSQLVNWTNLYQFLSRDDSNQHEYIENDYDCKHFSLELYKRAQAKGIACQIALISFAETRVGHSLVSFTTWDKGEVFVDFTPLIVKSKQRSSKSINMLIPGYYRIQVPLEQVPLTFTNNQQFYKQYVEQQVQLHKSAQLIKQADTDLVQLQQKLKGLEARPKKSAKIQRQIDQLVQTCAEKKAQILSAQQIYNHYRAQIQSPFDLTQHQTVIDITKW